MHDEASKALKNFSKIDVALIGGSGGYLEKILDIVDEKLKVGGHIAANFISIQNLSTCLDWLKRHENYHYETIQAQINRLRQIGSYDIAQAINPIYILTGIKDYD